MTPMRAVALLFTIAVVSAAVLALASRAPAEVRNAKPGAEAHDPSLGARFTPEQVARHGAYRGPGYLSLALSIVVELIALVLLARYLMPRALSFIEKLPGGWPVAVAAAAVFVIVVVMLATVPLGYVRGFANAHAWDLSTQSFGSWLSDLARSLLVAAVVSGVAAIAFFGSIRVFPRTWWLWGWVAFSMLSMALTFLFPIVIAPLFNKFTPLQDAALRERVVALADEAGVTLDDVLVADASKRTTTENAYVAGIGATKRMVLYDTLIEAGSEDETAYVAAHELGHEVHHHVWRGTLIVTGALFVGFAALAWLSGRPGIWGWAGAEGVGDLRALPVLALFVTIAGLVALPIQNGISRHFERQADTVALELTRDPDTAVETFRRLAFSNISDLRPPKVAEWLLFTHPSVPDRIERALSAAEPAATP